MHFQTRFIRDHPPNDGRLEKNIFSLMWINTLRREACDNAEMSKHTLIDATKAESLMIGEAVQASTAGIVSRTLLQSPELRVVLFTFAEGQELTPHTSRRRALVQIVEGSCEFYFADAWHKLGAGSFLHMPPDHLHAVKASFGTFTMLLTLGSEPALIPLSKPSGTIQLS